MTGTLIGPCRNSPPCIHQHVTIIGLSERRPRIGKHGIQHNFGAAGSLVFTSFYCHFLSKLHQGSVRELHTILKFERAFKKKVKKVILRPIFKRIEQKSCTKFAEKIPHAIRYRVQQQYVLVPPFF